MLDRNLGKPDYSTQGNSLEELPEVKRQKALAVDQFRTAYHHMNKSKKQKDPARIWHRDIQSKDCDKWSILGVATAISGKRQEMDSALARPTPTRQALQYNIYMLIQSAIAYLRARGDP